MEQDKRTGRPGLRAFIGASLALVAVIPAGLVGMYLIMTSTREAEEQALDRMQGVVASGSRAIEEHIYHHRHGLRLMVRNIAASNVPLETASLEGILKRYHSALDGFLSMHVSGADGSLIAVRLGDYADTEAARSLVGHQIDDRDYFQRALAGEEYISDAFLTRGTREEVVVAMSAPIIRDGQVVAVASATLRLDTFRDQIQELIPDWMDVVLTDGVGRVLVATDGTERMTPVGPLAQAAIREGTFTYRDADDDEHLAAKYPVIERWALYARTAPDFLLGTVTEKLHVSLGLLAGATLVALFLSRIIARSIARPIEGLIRSEKALNPSSPEMLDRSGVSWLTPRELVELLDITMERRALLAHSMEDVKLAHAEEQKLREELEAEVESRTAEIEDKTRQLKAAAAAAESASEAKSAFLANVSHEVRTPLASVIGFVETAREQVSNEQTMGMLGTALREARHLEHLLNDILDISRIEEGRLEVQCSEVDLSSLLSEIVKAECPAAERKGLNFSLAASYPLPRYLHTDELRLRQILTNLIGNAIKFTASGWVRLRVDWDGDSRIIFAVEDTGIGIDPDDQQKLFQRFSQADGSVTRRFGGSGLGLWISQALAQLLGGSISIHSVPARGSTFTVSLPAPAREQTTDLITDVGMISHKVKRDRRQRIDLVKGRVLLAEDNPNLQQLICHYLESAGADVVLAGNGLEALECARRQNFDLVLMDMHMPEMDGLTATRHLKDRDPMLPVVALTADIMHDRVRAQKEAGCVDTVGKPIDRSHLLRVVSHYLAAADTEAEGCGSQAGGKGGFVAEIAASFRASLTRDYLEPLHRGQADGEREQVISILHQLHGVAGNFGYDELTRLAAMGERRLRDGEDLAAIGNLIDDIQSAARPIAAEA